MKHSKPSPFAGQTVTIDTGDGPEKYHVEDWWDRVSGQSWMDAYGNPACLQYAVRSVGLPLDNEVLYGKVGPFGHLVHVSEIVHPGKGAGTSQ